MFDAHCHLQDTRLFKHVDEIIDQTRAEGISKVVCCGTREIDWPAVDRLFQRYPDFIIPSFGFHPRYLNERTENWIKALDRFISTSFCGVGEIGIDHTVKVDFKLQNQIFIQQLRLAKSFNLPISIHCCRAWQDLRKCLRLFAPFKQGGIIHSYSGSPEFIAELCQMGLSVSFSGAIDSLNNYRSKKALLFAPLDKIVVETNSPNLMPAGTMEIDESKKLIYTVKIAAQILGKSEDEFKKITSDNARKIFCLSH